MIFFYVFYQLAYWSVNTCLEDNLDASYLVFLELKACSLQIYLVGTGLQHDKVILHLIFIFIVPFDSFFNQILKMIDILYFLSVAFDYPVERLQQSLSFDVTLCWDVRDYDGRLHVHRLVNEGGDTDTLRWRDNLPRHLRPRPNDSCTDS